MFRSDSLVSLVISVIVVSAVIALCCQDGSSVKGKFRLQHDNIHCPACQDRHQTVLNLNRCTGVEDLPSE